MAEPVRVALAAHAFNTFLLISILENIIIVTMKIHDDGHFLPRRGVRDGDLGRPVVAVRFLGPGVPQVPHNLLSTAATILDP